MRKMIPQNYFPVFGRVPIQAPHVFAQKLVPQDFFPACIGFVPGGYNLDGLARKPNQAKSVKVLAGVPARVLANQGGRGTGAGKGVVAHLQTQLHVIADRLGFTSIPLSSAFREIS